MRAGLVGVPANLHYTSSELSYIARDADVSLLLLDDTSRVDGSGASVLAPSKLIATAVGTTRTASQRKRNDDDINDDEIDGELPLDDATALIAYTSGTTGKPKGAMLTHGNLLASAQALRIAWQWTQHDRLLLALPLFHIHGLGVGVHGTLLAGGSMSLLAKFDAERAVAAIDADKPTLFFSVPTIYTRLVDAPTHARAFRSLRLCVSGSAALSTDIHQRFRAATDQGILERYGCAISFILSLATFLTHSTF